jgi:hypothetical protein
VGTKPRLQLRTEPVQHDPISIREMTRKRRPNKLRSPTIGYRSRT